MMVDRCSLWVVAFLLASVAKAQTAVPYTTQAGHFGVFQNGVFSELEPRVPRTVHPNGERLFYVSQEGDLRGYMDGHAITVQREEPTQAFTTRGAFAWKQGEALRVVRNEGPQTICYDVGTFSVRDSLVAFHNEIDRTLSVYWRGRSFPIADLLMDDGTPEWKAGSNTLVFYVRDQRKVLVFYRGETTELCHGADYALVSCGGDIVAYMDDGDDIFRVFDRGERIDLEDLRPVDFTAGLGILGYVSGTGKFRCYDGRSVITLAAQAPAAYHVQDSVITWVEDGQWKTLNDGRVDVLERYVPENWQVSGANIAYQDLNRELRFYHRGKRSVVTKEAGVKRFELHGDAVVWQSNGGSTKVWWNGKIHERY
jgi:hypothetical protein